MSKCLYCKELNKDNTDVYTSQIYKGGWFYHYKVPIIYCPFCGKKLNYWKTHKYNPNIHGGDEDEYGDNQ